MVSAEEMFLMKKLIERSVQISTTVDKMGQYWAINMGDHHTSLIQQ